MLAPDGPEPDGHTISGSGSGEPASVDRAWLQKFAYATRTLTLSTLSITNSCIYTTRIAQAALSRVGLNAKAVPVFVTVSNREAFHLAEQGVPIAEWPTSAHSVGVDERTRLSNATGWNGHLVLILRQPDRPRLLIDLTADQFSRPIRNLIVGGPVFMDIPADKVWTPRDPLYTVMNAVKDPGPGADGVREIPQTIAAYRPMPSKHPEAKRWLTTPDWTMAQDDVDANVDYILRMVEDPDFVPVVSGNGASEGTSRS